MLPRTETRLQQEERKVVRENKVRDTSWVRAGGDLLKSAIWIMRFDDIRFASNSTDYLYSAGFEYVSILRTQNRIIRIRFEYL